MKRFIFIFAMLLCVFPSYAISKKKVLAQRNELVSKILKEYKFKSNFDSISVALQTAYYTKAKELIETTYAQHPNATDEYRKHIIGENKVWCFKIDDKLVVLDSSFGYTLFWHFEGPYLLKEYPEIIELDSLLIKKKCGSYRLKDRNSWIVMEWRKNIDFDSNIYHALERYTREMIEKEERLKKEKEAYKKEQQRQRAQTPRVRKFYSEEYCRHDNTKWSEWEKKDTKVIVKIDLERRYDRVIIDGYDYYAYPDPDAVDRWYLYYDFDLYQYFNHARLEKGKNGTYYLYIENTSETICYKLKIDDRDSPAVRAKLSLNEWIIGIWEGRDDGENYIAIYKDYIKMSLHRYQAVYNEIDGIKYQIDGNHIITNLKNGTITIDRSNGCLYFRGVKYTFKRR